MATRRLSLAEIRAIDLEIVVMDLADRDKLMKKRSLVLQIDFVPGSTDGRVAVSCHAHSKLPARVTEVYWMTRVGENGLAFNATSPEDPDQMTLDALEEKGEDEV